MGVRGGIGSGLVAALLLGLATPAGAQFSDSYGFLKAVKDRDGDKVMTFLNKPGQPALNAKDASTGDGALHIVVRRHDQQWLAFLLSRGADMNMRDKDGDTPLLIAAQLSDTEIARILVSVGATVDATNSRGETALIVAVQQRDLATVNILLAGGADPKKSDTIAGKSARDYAADDTRSAAILKVLDAAKVKPAPAKVSGPTLTR